MELVLIEPNSPEWEYMWKWLEEHPINKDIEEPTLAMNEGEAWQYMGTFKQDDRIIHEFRHRNHPATGLRQYLKVSGSDTFTQEQIHKKFKL